MSAVEKVPWTRRQLMLLASGYNTGQPKREIFSELLPHTTQACEQRLSILRKRKLLISQLERRERLRGRWLRKLLAERSEQPPLAQWPPLGVILFADDARALRDRGSAAGLLVRPLTLPRSASSTAWAAEG
jgi:hypothetical protein